MGVGIYFILFTGVSMATIATGLKKLKKPHHCSHSNAREENKINPDT